jgi:uncharacterized membrane protein YkoI
MTATRSLTTAALLAGALCASAAPAIARDRHAASAGLVRVQARDVGPAAAAEAARGATGGRVLGVRAKRAKGRIVYRVKVLLPEGRVRTVTVDGASGRVGG